MSESIKKISAISIFVEDVVASRDFYREVFDADIVFEDDVSAVVQLENLLLNLLLVTEAAGLVAPGKVAAADSGSRFQISVWVNDVDAVCAELVSRGVTILAGPVDKPWGMRVVTFVDPSGTSWEIAHSIPNAIPSVG